MTEEERRRAYEPASRRHDHYQQSRDAAQQESFGNCMGLASRNNLAALAEPWSTEKMNQEIKKISFSRQITLIAFCLGLLLGGLAMWIYLG